MSGLQKIQDLKRRLQELKKLPQIALDVLKDLEPELADEQTDQWSKGFESLGGFIGELRNDEYARQKLARGGKAPFGQVDLKDTGDFYSGTFARVQGKKITFDSRDSKRQEIVEKYSDKIFGLNDNQRIKFIEEQFKPEMQFRVKKILNG